MELCGQRIAGKLDTNLSSSPVKAPCEGIDPRGTQPALSRASVVARRRAVLVIIPGDVNYFYNLHGRRVAEALEDLGFIVDLHTLASAPSQHYDLCLLANCCEVLYSAGNEDVGRKRLADVRRHCNLLLASCLDAVQTPWFRNISCCAEAIGVDFLLDFGFHDQREDVAASVRPNYRFLLAGATRSELRSLRILDDEAVERKIPWAFVGHCTNERLKLADDLVKQFDPRGFIYLPLVLSPYKEKGSPHLNQGQFEKVLRQTRYQIWCSHHQHFYMESERFRMSLLTGGVPIKILTNPRPRRITWPFDYLMIDAGRVGPQLASLDYDGLCRRFRDDFCSLPTLAMSLQAFLKERGLLDNAEVPGPASQSGVPLQRQDAV